MKQDTQENQQSQSKWGQIADQLLADMAKGEAPWVRPWDQVQVGPPRSGKSGYIYRGANWMLLSLAVRRFGWEDPRFFTFKQAKQLAGGVREGERSIPIFFWEEKVKFKRPFQGKLWWSRSDRRLQAAYPEGLPDDAQLVRCLRSFPVFNAVQCQQPPERSAFIVLGNDRTRGIFPMAESLEQALSREVAVRFGGNKACYWPSKDLIHMPPRERFSEAAGYFATLFHEYVHATGHESRHKRTFGNERQSLAYAVEELVAESGAAFVLSSLGLPYDTQHASYLKSWASNLQKLPEDERHRRLMSAFSAGQKAADWVLGHLPASIAMSTEEVQEEFEFAEAA